MGRKPTIKQRNTNFKKKEHYQQLLLSLFKIHGISKYNMDTIAKELNISKSTLYEYFNSKDEMVQYILDTILFNLRDVEKILLAKKTPYIERYYNGLNYISDAIHDISGTLLDDLKNEYPQHWKDIQAFIEYISDLLTDYYNEGKQLGYFRTIDTKILVLSDRLFFNAISDTAYLQKNNISPQLLFDEYFKLKSKGFII